jgi:hypothetical protein
LRLWRSQRGSLLGAKLVVGGNNAGLQEARRGVGTANHEVGLAAVAKGVENVAVSEQVTSLVDEETVAEEGVVIAAGAGRFVEAVKHRAETGVGGRVWSRRVSCKKSNRTAAPGRDE